MSSMICAHVIAATPIRRSSVGIIISFMNFILCPAVYFYLILEYCLAFVEFS